MQYLYEETPPKAWATTCVSIYVVAVVATGIATLPDDLGAFLAVSGMYLFVLVPCLGVPISKWRYHRIQLTHEVLRVGRERLAVADLDPVSVRAAAQEPTPAMAERFATSMARNDVPGPARRSGDREGPRLVGGAWGVPMGMDSVVVTTRRGEPLCIATRKRTEFLAAPARATAH